MSTWEWVGGLEVFPGLFLGYSTVPLQDAPVPLHGDQEAVEVAPQWLPRHRPGLEARVGREEAQVACGGRGA